MERALFTEKFKAYLKASNEGSEAIIDTLTSDDNLFNLGLVDSFRLPRIIRFLEEITEEEIPVENATIEAFYTLNTIYDTFLQPYMKVK